MLLAVEEALKRVLDAAHLTHVFDCPIEEADGYTLACDLVSKRSQPPFAASAMDGYAVCHTDLQLGQSLDVVGESAAGHAFAGIFSKGQAVRIFTGAPMPKGTDTVLIQEDTERTGDAIMPQEIPARGLFVRPVGMDFTEGEVILEAGTLFDFRTLSLAAAANNVTVPVHSKPKVAILSNGDELIFPGGKPDKDQIISSNAFGMASIIKAAGGTVVNLGIARDRKEEISSGFDRALQEKCDIIVTLGGASVGDHDLIKPALSEKGATLDFWKIAMRPGKPFMFGMLDDMFVLGMPGNPVSSLVCGLLFLKPLVLAMQNRDPSYKLENAVLAAPLGKNGPRQAYLRAFAARSQEGLVVQAFDQQDSSILSILAKANALLIRPAHAAKAEIGDNCQIMWIT